MYSAVQKRYTALSTSSGWNQLNEWTSFWSVPTYCKFYLLVLENCRSAFALDWQLLPKLCIFHHAIFRECRWTFGFSWKYHNGYGLGTGAPVGPKRLVFLFANHVRWSISVKYFWITLDTLNEMHVLTETSLAQLFTTFFNSAHGFRSLSSSEP